MKSIIVTATLAFAPLAAKALDYERDIMPIFEEKCAKCHSEKAEKVKGGLRLDDPEDFHNRFAKNDVVIPGDWDASYLFVTISRPHEDEDAMPPTDKGSPLTPEEVLLVANWIYEGAPINGKRGDKGKPDDRPEDVIQPGRQIQEKLVSSRPPEPEERKWTNREGKAIVATLLRVDGDSAVLRLTNGKAYRYPIANLSDESQAFLRESGDGAGRMASGN